MLEIQNNYDASHIQVLEGREAVRKRPAMYIGDTSVKGLHHLVSEVVDSCIDEALAGYCNDLQVFILPDNSIKVVDNGRGIPVDTHRKEHRSALELVMTVLHAGGKFDKNAHKVAEGLHGVGVSCLDALADHFVAEVHRQDHIYRQEYAFGKPISSVEIIDDAEDTITTVGTFPKTSVTMCAYYSVINAPHYNNYIVIIASRGDDAVPIANDWRDLLYLYSRYCRDIKFFHARSSSGGLPYIKTPNGESVPNCLSQSLYYLLIPKILNASNYCVANNLLAA